MNPASTERALDDAIECALLQGGPDACPDDKAHVRKPRPGYGPAFEPGGYYRRTSTEFDRYVLIELRCQVQREPEAQMLANVARVALVDVARP